MTILWLKIIIYVLGGFLEINHSPKSEVINGLNFVAPPRPFHSDPMVGVRNIGANWIAVIPYASARLGTPIVRHDASSYQWWGEKPPGVIETIRRAQSNGIKVMLKPQIYIHGSWPGEIDFQSPQDWRLWEQSYRNYLMGYVHIADSLDVDLICIGTELRLSSIKRPFFWKSLITEIRSIYDGQLTYAANWDDYENILFWSDLDFVGIDAYFPLDPAKTPTVQNLLKSWTSIARRLEHFSRELDRMILFTEYGYLSVDHCADKNWELEKIISTLDVNQEAQANALEALYRTFHSSEFWAGGFLWKWFPNMEGHEGYVDRDYTPQGKAAHSVVKSWFGR